MILPEILHDQIVTILDAPIERVEPIGQSFGAHLARLSSPRGRFALKWASQPLPHALATEARGLELLNTAQAVRVPQVVAVNDPTPESGYAFLLSTWLEGSNTCVDMAVLGTQLATLHRSSAPAYGLDHDNYIGGNAQHNGWDTDWPHFFAEYRLLPQINLAGKQGRLQRSRRRNLERLLERIGDLLAGVPRQPALLHGDLWGGNVIATAPDSAPGLIDPAVYYGDREAEIAFTELFGGFSSAFYTAYNDAWPLAPGYAQRRDLYNLYHLLNHLNLFGEGYGGHVDQIAQRYGG
ncbi:MAG: fructosamine kinase family protein [Oscillochloris sp.]|nr:fructosamine kinase family protein [Oscillochloris sp.]